MRPRRALLPAIALVGVLTVGCSDDAPTGTTATTPTSRPDARATPATDSTMTDSTMTDSTTLGTTMNSTPPPESIRAATTANVDLATQPAPRAVGERRFVLAAGTANSDRRLGPAERDLADDDATAAFGAVTDHMMSDGLLDPERYVMFAAATTIPSGATIEVTAISCQGDATTPAEALAVYFASAPIGTDDTCYVIAQIDPDTLDITAWEPLGGA